MDLLGKTGHEFQSAGAPFAKLILHPPGRGLEQPALEAPSVLIVLERPDGSHHGEQRLLNHVFRLGFRQPGAAGRVEDELPVEVEALPPTFRVIRVFQPGQQAGTRRDPWIVLLHLLKIRSLRVESFTGQHGLDRDLRRFLGRWPESPRPSEPMPKMPSGCDDALRGGDERRPEI